MFFSLFLVSFLDSSLNCCFSLLYCKFSFECRRFLHQIERVAKINKQINNDFNSYCYTVPIETLSDLLGSFLFLMVYSTIILLSMIRIRRWFCSFQFIFCSKVFGFTRCYHQKLGFRLINYCVTLSIFLQNVLALSEKR